MYRRKVQANIRNYIYICICICIYIYIYIHTHTNNEGRKNGGQYIGSEKRHMRLIHWTCCNIPGPRLAAATHIVSFLAIQINYPLVI